MKRNAPPPIEVRNIQRAVRISVRELQLFAEIACALAWKRKRPRSDIVSAKTISVLIVSDQRMATLHKKFCGLTGPTDVLTFQHGEIVICAETARRQARVFRTGRTGRELRLYILHGLLHLCGYDDTTAATRVTLQRVQAQLMREALRLEAGKQAAEV